MKHVEIRRIVDIVFGGVSAPMEKKHLSVCTECSGKAARLFETTRKALGGRVVSECDDFDANTIAKYVDGSMTGNEKAGYEKHLLACVDCLAGVKDVIKDMSAFGETRQNKREPIEETVIRIAKSGMELIGKMMQPAPVFEYAVELRGKKRKPPVIRMIWTRLNAYAKFVMVLKHGPGSKAGLSVEVVSMKEKTIMLDLVRNGSTVERKVVVIRSKKGQGEFGIIGKGLYQLQSRGSPVFDFRIE